MKHFLIACLTLLFLSAGCKKVEKNVRNYYPRVETVSAVIQSDGSVKLMGRLLSAGAGELYGVGMCMDTLPNPEMHINQVICDTLFGNEFYSVYANLDARKKYYFRTWATNANGYSYGKDIVVATALLDSSLLPCWPQLNSITVTPSNPGIDMFRTIDPVVRALNWEFRVYSDYHTLKFFFHKIPTTGIYRIIESESLNQATVQILYNGSSTSGTYLKSGNVYVSQLTGDTIEVTVCNTILSTWNAPDRTITARFRTRLP